MMCFTYIWNLKANTLTDIENRFVVARGKGWDLGKIVKVFQKYKFPVIQ